jgi:hypothetical protein
MSYREDDHSAADNETYVKENKYRIPINGTRTPQANQFERSSHFSSAKNVKGKHVNQMNSIKN